MTFFSLRPPAILVALSLLICPFANAKFSTRTKKCSSYGSKLRQAQKAYAVKLSDPKKVQSFFRKAEFSILTPRDGDTVKSMTLDESTLSKVTLDTSSKVITKNYNIEAEDIGRTYYAREKFLNEELRSRNFPVAEVLRYNDEELRIYKPLIIGFTAHSIESTRQPGSLTSEVLNEGFDNIRSILNAEEVSALLREIKRLKTDLAALERDKSFIEKFRKQKLSTLEPRVFDFTGFPNNILIRLDGDHLKIVIIDP